MRPSFRKNKISKNTPVLIVDDNAQFNLSEDKIVETLAPFAKFPLEDNTNDEPDLDEEIFAYKQYMQRKIKPKYSETQKYKIKDGIEIYVDKNLALSPENLLNEISFVLKQL